MLMKVPRPSRGSGRDSRVLKDPALLAASLDESEARFRAVADASGDAFYICKNATDSSGNVIDFEILDVNKVVVERLGLPREKLVGRNFGVVLPFARTSGMLARAVEVANSGTRFEGDFPLDIPGRARRWVHHNIVRLGEGIALSSRDITESKASEEKRRESEERLRLALEIAHAGAWTWDIASNSFSGSESLGPIFGLPRGTTLPSLQALLAVIHPDDRAEIAGAFRRARDSGEPYQTEFRVVWPDGSLHWVDGRGRVVCDDHGKPVRAVGVGMDVTERKASEHALQRAHRALRTVSSVNSHLVRATEESQLLMDVCRTIVDEGGYLFAGVGYARDDFEKSINPVAIAGAYPDFVAQGIQTWADTEVGQRPISRAIRTGKPEIARTISQDAAFAQFHDAARSRGFESNLALPLSDEMRTFGALSIYASGPDAFNDDELAMLQELADDLTFGILALRTRAERDRHALAIVEHERVLTSSLRDTVAMVATIVEMRDPYTAGHQHRVAELAVAIGQELGLAPTQLDTIRLAGIVHDVGKIQVPAEILSKPGKLSAAEYELLKTHPEAGYQILKNVAFPWPIADIVRQHHERMDGTGYPNGLRGEQILIESRILAVADVVEAMAAYRPYRRALGIDIALAEIERGKGLAYDAQVVNVCLKLLREGRFRLPG